MKRPGSLFHTIVVVGASIGAGGCGADEQVPDARTSAQPDATQQVADARPADASPFDAGPDATPDAVPDAMIIIL